MKRALAISWILLLTGIVIVMSTAPRAQVKWELFMANSGTAATTCSAGTTVVNRLDGSQSAGVSQAYQNFICGLITDGLASGNFTSTCGSIFDQIGIFWTNNSTNAGIQVCNTTYTLANGGATFTAFSGWSTAAAANEYFDTGYNPSTGAVNYATASAHISCYMVAGSATTGTPCMSLNNITGINIYPHFTGTGSFFRINDSPESGAQTDQGTQVGHWVANRTGVSASSGYYNGTAVNAAINESSAAAGNADILLLAANKTSNPTNPGTIGAFTIGAQMTGAQISSLYTRLNNFCHDTNINAC